MSFYQIVRQNRGDPHSVPPHEHDGSEISGSAVFLTLRANDLVGGTIHGKEITIAGDGFIQSEGYDPNTVGGEGWRVAGDGSANFLGEFNVGSNVVSAIQFIRANDGHLSLVEIDAVTTDVFNIDVAGGVMRIRFLDLDAETVTAALTIGQDGTVTVETGALVLPNGDAANPSITFGASGAGFFYDPTGNGAIGIAI